MPKYLKVLFILLTCLFITGCGNKKTEITSYSVEFNTNSTKTIASITNIESGSTITLPTNPTKDGYVFGGWYTDNETFLEEFTSQTIVKKNYIVYAKWLKICTISFDTNGGTVISNKITAVEGTTINLPTNPTKEGKKFAGWYTDDESFLVPFTRNTKVSDSVTLYAKWDDKTYTVSFNSNGGTNVSSIENVIYNNTITIPNEPTKENFHFAGWYDSTLEELYDENTKITNNLTLYAKWLSDSEGLEFTLKSDGTYEVSGVGTCTDKEICIPSTYQDISITSIAPNAFEGASIEIVIMPDTIKKVEEYAFMFCSKLNYVKFSASLEEVGVRSFYECSKLKQLVLPATLTVISDDTFCGCSALTKIQMTENINYKAINNCLISKRDKKLIAGTTYSIIPNDVLIIGYYSFGNTSITSLILPEGVKIIEECAFYNCSSLEYIDLPKSLEQIGISAFDNCKKISKIFYGGTQDEFSSIAILERNEFATTVPIYCYSDTKLGYSWHYENGVKTVWTEEKFMIVFHSNNGNQDISFSKIPYGWTFDTNLVSVPSKDGYQFDGWYIDNKTFETPFTNTTVITQNYDVYAKWKEN